MTAPDIDTTKKSVLTAIENRPTQNGTYWGQRGTFLAETGPLAALQNRKKYSSQSLSYPRDLNSDQKQHSVQFAIRPAKSEGDPVGKFKAATLSTAKEGLELAVKSGEAVGEEVTDVMSGKKSAGQAAAELFVAAAEQTDTILAKAAELAKTKPYVRSATAIINLYMPDGIEFGQHASYNQIGLLDAAASIPFVGKIPSVVLSTLKNDAMRLTLNAMGYVFNPQEQVLFEGMDFRTFNMSFTFTPFSSDEAKQVRDIIKTFRKNAAPTIQTGGAKGFFYTPPSVFDISFYKGSSVNENINKLKECVLTDVTVNYAPNGTWSTYDDGMPVQTTLSLSFKEIELVDSVAINQGF
jgi:hypothetical protein